MREVSSLPVVDYATPERTRFGLSDQAWIRIALVTLAMVGVFWPNLRRLWFKTNFFTGEANWQHAPLVPLIGLYYLYLNREALLKAEVRPILWGRFWRRGRLGIGLALAAGGAVGAWVMHNNPLMLVAARAMMSFGLFIVVLDWGMGTLLFGLATFAYGIYPGQNDFVKDFGMVITLFGVVTMLCGWEVMKIAWFPIVFLVAAIPWPQLVYSWVAMPLQEMAASAAVFTLRMTGVEAIRDGTSLVIGAGVNARTLNVAEACAGLKSLMAFVTLAAAIGFLSSRPLWQKITVTVSAVPIAIFCNMMRVSGQGLLDNWGLRQLSEGFAHQFVGMVMLIPAFFLILGVAYLMDNLFVDEEQRKREAQKRGIKGVESLVIEAPRRVAGPGAPDEPAAKEDLAAATRRLMTASLRRRPGAHAAGHASSPRPEAS